MADTIKKIKVNKDVSVWTYFSTVDASSNQIATASTVSSPTINPMRRDRIWDFLQQRGEVAYAIKGNANKAVELIEVVDGSYCKRIPLTNKYKFLTEEESKSVVKGKKFEAPQQVASHIDNVVLEKFVAQGKTYSGESAYSNVFYEPQKKIDYYANVTIKRTVDTLDTLSVKNNPLSEIPSQESETGVVCGTLLARQKVLDENGERVLIPLSNVPIVVFNPSEEFPLYSSQDVDGNRITLNLIQNSTPAEYADTQSYVLDVGTDLARKNLGSDKVGEDYEGIKPLLKSVETLFVPEQYKYSTVTNDKGEFIIQDVPVGNQVLLFEVDLLKQGMTKTEVGLNFFPYSNEELPNVDNIPHFYYRQIPIGVTSSWGAFQTGYTEVNITANLDMRKWNTFYVPPISVSETNLDDLFAAGNFAPLTILARDMTKEGYPLTTDIVEISDVFSRVKTQRLEWFNEIRASKPNITFTKNDYQIFKLPANLYDPNGNASNESSRKSLKSKKGVWLSCYQMKMYYESIPSVFRATGFVRSALEGDSSLVNSNHFDLNRGPGSDESSATGKPENSSLNTFPYEQPWTINYPAPYSIPSEPTQVNESINFSNQVEPRYLDGDKAGLYWGQELSSGYGLMNPLEGGEAIYNKFAQTVTKGSIYKYENNVSWHEEYSNGFRKARNASLFPNKSFNVNNGEEYQRLESGFGYFIRPEGWGRISHNSWGDIMLNSDIVSTSTLPQNLYPTSYLASMFRQGESLTIRMDTSARPIWIRTGAIDFYRLVNDLPSEVSDRKPPLTKKYAQFQIGDLLRNNEKTSSQELKLKFGNQKDEMTTSASSLLEVRNNGSIKANVTVSGVKQSINPGEESTFTITAGSTVVFDANTDFDFVDNTYNTATYGLWFKNSEIKDAGEIVYYADFSSSANISSEIPTKYLVSTIVDCDGNVRLKTNSDDEVYVDKCKSNFTKDGDYEVNGLVFEKTRSDKVEIRFKDEEVDIHCSDGGFGIRKIRPIN